MVSQNTKGGSSEKSELKSEIKNKIKKNKKIKINTGMADEYSNK